MASLVERKGMFYLQWRVGGKIRRRSLRTSVKQIAKDKLRQFESARLRGVEDMLPTRTPIAEVVTAYVDHIRHVKTPKSAQTDIYYLREAFGPICDALRVTSRRITEAARKRPRKPGEDRRRRQPTLVADYFESITTCDISTFIDAHKSNRGLAPKTANRYREILVRLFNWAATQRNVRVPGGRNPAAAVQRYVESAPEIRYLTLLQIAQQLDALAHAPQLQAMVATLIYAGLRREELLWLRLEDIVLAAPYSMIHVRAKTVGGESWQPKTKQNRAVPIIADLLRYLRTYAPRPCPGDWFFPSPSGGRWDPDNFSAYLRVTNTAAALPWNCLLFRHTFGSQLAQNGISLYKISSVMGNSPEICRRHYACLHPETMGEDLHFPIVRTCHG